MADESAPAHLHIATQNAASWPGKICTRATFSSATTRPSPSEITAAGLSHVLPTSGTARFASGLSSNDFLRGGSILQFSQQGLDELAADVRAHGKQRRTHGALGQRGQKDYKKG